jgi:Tol biopolymer transport system component
MSIISIIVSESIQTSKQGRHAQSSDRSFTMTIRFLFFVAAILGAIITGCASPEPSGRIVFHSDRSGNTEIFSVNVDGSNEEQLTANDAFDGFPSWSADGSRIFFQSDRNDDDAIYVMADDGSNVTRIPHTENGRYPKVSPDGGRLAFFAERNGQTDIFVVDLDGDNLFNLTENSSTDETPSWTQDGAMIAFQSDRNWLLADPEAAAVAEHSNFGIFLMNADGSNVVEITGIETNDENPSIAPNGQQIVYQSYVADGLVIASVNVRSGDTAYLTALTRISGSPASSSSGRSIVFDSNDDGNFDIFVMSADGSNRQQVTYTLEGENSGAAMFDGSPAKP